jgi:hypothetical protein
MNYKFSTVVLFLALIAMIAYHFSTVKNGIEKPITEEGSQEEKQQASQEDYEKSHLDKELSKLFADKVAKGVDSTLGDFISFNTGKAKLDSIKDYRRRNPGRAGIHNSYGYIFGLQKMRALIERIDKINKAQDSLDLTGIRVYRTISRTKGKRHFDVFMIAVTKDNKDFPDLGNDHLPFVLDDGNPILNVSTPCPTDCSDVF